MTVDDHRIARSLQAMPWLEGPPPVDKRTVMPAGVIFDPRNAAAQQTALREQPIAPLIAEVKTRSMLAVESLLMINAIARDVGGPVLEIGAYMGGATAAAALGLRAAGRGRVISVDRGGAYPTHPHLPTSDIYAAWHSTIERFGVVDQAVLIEGFTFRPQTQQRIREACGQDPIRLVMLDADGFVFAHLSALFDLLAPDCWLMIDDYKEPLPLDGANVTAKANIKAERTATIVDRAVERGVIETYAVLPWATWFGRLTPRFAELAVELAAIEIAEREAFLMARDGNLDNRNPPGGFQPLH